MQTIHASDKIESIFIETNTSNSPMRYALTFIGCADALGAALSNGEAHTAVVTQIAPTIESSDKGVKVIDRGEGEATEQNGTGIVEGGIDLLTILSGPLRRGLQISILIRD